jgi:hypothetical protein
LDPTGPTPSAWKTCGRGSVGATSTSPNPAIYRGDPAYLAELRQRWTLLWGTRMDVEPLFVEPAAAYWQTDPQ